MYMYLWDFIILLQTLNCMKEFESVAGLDVTNNIYRKEKCQTQPGKHKSFTTFILEHSEVLMISN